MEDKVTGLYRREGSTMWWMRFRLDGVRKHESTGTSDLEEAKEILRQAKRNVVSAKRQEKDRERAGEMAGLCLHKALDLAELEYYRNTKSNKVARTMFPVVKSILGDIPLSSVDKATYNKLKIGLRQREKLGSNSTINRYIALFNRTLKHAIEFHNAECNPLEGQYVKENGQRLRVITYEEEAQIREYLANYVPERRMIDWTGQDLVDIYDVLVHTGMRRAELFNAKVRHLRDNLLELPTHKSDYKGMRTVVLNNYVQSIIKRRIEEKKPDDHIFPYSMERFSWLWRKMRDNLGITDEDFVVHTTRHTFVSRLAMKGANIYKVSKLLGHSSVTTTERYGHLFNGELQDVVDLLEA